MVLVRTTKTILPDTDPCGIKDARLNLNTQNIYGWPAFHYACYDGNTSLISLILINCHQLHKKLIVYF